MKFSYYTSLLKSTIPSLYYNIKYLPLNQAIKLPILLYKSKIKGNGKIIIESSQIKRGMIQIGFNRCRIYPNNGSKITIEGELRFKGRCEIKNDVHILVSKNGILTIDQGGEISGGCKIVTNYNIRLGKNTSLGWGCIVTDSNFHPIYDIDKKNYKQVFGPIEIGNYNWLGMQCVVMHSVKTPERCIFGARSILTRGAKYESYCIHGGNPLKVLTRNVYRDFDNDNIDYNIQIK